MSKKMKSTQFPLNKSNTAAGEAAVLPLQSFFAFFMGILLTFMVLSRGAFFPEDKILFSLIFLLLGVVVFALTSLFRHRVWWDSIHGFSPLLLLAAYWVPVITFQWVVLWEALTMILYYVVAVVVFILVRNLNRNNRYTEMLLNLMLVAGIIVATTALMGAAQLWDYPDLVMSNRLAGIFQYPNTLAAWMMTLYFVSNGLMLEASQKWKKVAYGSIGFFMLFVFVFTYSRAAWLLFPLIALFFLIILPGKNRIMMLLTYIISGVPLLVALMPFYRATTGSEAGGFSVFAIILAATAAFGLLLAGLLRLSNRMEDFLQSQQHTHLKKVLFIAMGAVLLGAAVLLMVALQATEPLVFDNMDLEEPRNQTLTRTLSDMQPLTAYELHLQLETQGGNEEQWPWLVEVISENAGRDSTRILQHVGVKEVSGEIMIPFETLEDTTALRIVFRNQFENTAVTFHEATVIHPEADLFYSIPLQYRVLPEGLVQRLENIGREENSADTRLTYYRDSMTILRSHPVGAGGGAWDALYREYQSQPYYSRQVHNFFLQTAVEAGYLGLILLASMVGLIIWGLYQSFRAGHLLQTSLHVAVLSLLGHSFLDFNFSYLATFLFYWMLLALLQPPLWPSSWNKKVSPRVSSSDLPGWAASLVLIPVLVLAMTAWGASRSHENAVLYGQTGEAQLAYDTFEQAASLDRLRPEYRLDLTSNLLQLYSTTGDQVMLTVANHHWQQGMRYAPRHRELIMAGVDLKIYQGEFQEAGELIQQRITEAPLDRTGYEEVSAAYLNLVKFMSGNSTQDASPVEPALAETAQEGLQLLHIQQQANQQAKVPLAITSVFKNNLMYLRAWQEFAAGNLPFALNPSENPLYVSFLDLEYATGAEQAWRAWGREDAQLTTTLTDEGLLTINTGTDLGLAHTPNIPLQSKTTYQVWVDFAQISLEAPLQIHVIATDSEGGATQHTHILTQEETKNLAATFTFTIIGDIDPVNDQYIRFDHPGRSPESDANHDPGSFTIRGVVVQQTTNI
ncbi:O-antigen ligase family protein [Anoxynatronum buryatiense]|uniref:O-Antigen ligase n=1 Tax=Anoxynatronum buryatiense TaxID=489973 RepID=A0AA45WW67_9CLOT|nr:O-antigen ligase family protein [Anoxynatronum buryatiense]SMP56653.1 O-Antigen ligase [Anoxynatronum buryatiense]